jgi:hypothetical protein
LERLPANNLIVNINESMIGENDFVLTGKDLDALMADKQSHRTSGKVCFGLLGWKTFNNKMNDNFNGILI